MTHCTERGTTTAEHAMGTHGADVAHHRPRSAAAPASAPMSRERGMVTAELMTIAPFGVALAFLLLWVVSLGLTQVRLADAARESARLVARGESHRTAEKIAERHAPGRATVDVTTRDGTVTVTVRARSRMPIPFFSGIGSRSMESTAVAAAEVP